MEITKKLFSLGFAYNAKGNIFDKPRIPKSLIREYCFFKYNNGTHVELYAPNPNGNDMWDHVIATSDFNEILLEEIIPAQSILNL
jgi:hypothetical protein